MARKKGSTDYPLEIKVQAVKMCLEEGRSYTDITQILGIRDPERVEHWVSLYRKEGEKALKKPRRGRPKKIKGEETPQQKIARLEMENALLKKYHAELQKLTGGKPGTGPFITSKPRTR